MAISVGMLNVRKLVGARLKFLAIIADEEPFMINEQTVCTSVCVCVCACIEVNR